MSPQAPDLERRVQILKGEADRLRESAQAVVRGQGRAIEDYLLCAGANGHLLMLGVPGTGKTLLAKVLGRLTGLSAGRIQFTQDLLPADITGHYLFDRSRNEFQLRRGSLFNNIVLADEINRSPPKAQSAMLEAMEERQVTIEGRTHPLPSPFTVVATMNPIELEGVYELPVAELDRFMIQTRMDYPDEAAEREILRSPPPGDLGSLAPLPPHFIQRLQETVPRVRCHPDVDAYITSLARSTRDDDHVLLGLSPRGSRHVQSVARAHAVLRGRAYVTPSDVQESFRRVAPHRIRVRPEDEVDGWTAARVVADRLDAVATPETR